MYECVSVNTNISEIVHSCQSTTTYLNKFNCQRNEDNAVTSAVTVTAANCCTWMKRLRVQVSSNICTYVWL